MVLTYHDGSGGSLLALLSVLSSSPALSNVWAPGLLADRVQTETTKVLLNLSVRPSSWDRVLEERWQTRPGAREGSTVGQLVSSPRMT